MSDVKIDGYDGFRLLGRGGFSAVYEARQIGFDRQVAVKVLDVGIMDDAVRRRVARESAATGRLTGHPNIVTVLEAGFLGDGRPFLTMVLCRGGSMADRIGRDGPLPLGEVLRVGVKIAGALQSAHQADIVHRDIKPENILITALGEPTLADFGIATISDHHSLTRNTQAYTPNHAAPEVLLGRAASTASDVYNLGSTLYHLLAGHPPFAMTGPAGLAVFVDRVLNQQAPPPREGLPASLLAVLHRAMAKDPADRYASAEQLGQALREVQRELGLPVDALVVTTVAGAGAPAQAIVDPSGTILDPPPPPAVPPATAPAAPPNATVHPQPPAQVVYASGQAQPATLGGPGSYHPTLQPPPSGDAPAPRRKRLLAAVLGILLLLAAFGGAAAWALNARSDLDQTSSATPTGGAASGQPVSASVSASPPASASPTVAGASIGELSVSNAECGNQRSDGTWRGSLKVSWRADGADAVKLSTQASGSGLGSFGTSGSETFQLSCEPGTSFVLRATPYLRSTPGSAKEQRGSWPPAIRVASLKVSGYTCSTPGHNGDQQGSFKVQWSATGADEVRFFYEGDQDRRYENWPTSPNGTFEFSGRCDPGGSPKFVRAIAFKDGTAHGFRDVTIRWP
ncbi:serine/threonine protein kinase [Allocatelliglobosispora scoriae]|uniref:non-specific serine/threonine protein kinase n=1 Tax=Allocatelliglobosispora scoriae TaxID=643052 RepID=A0A841BIZ9_9ACTN|nr:serine/threonine-protein kinase [Allocatelliglobosispora scoriae]MBB5866752.1 serine/threonine protein kinase [Allocatelliglobosispora scoriae]